MSKIVLKILEAIFLLWYEVYHVLESSSSFNHKRNVPFLYSSHVSNFLQAARVFHVWWFVHISCVNLYFFRVVMIWWIFVLFWCLVMFHWLLCFTADIWSNGHQNKTRAAKCSCWESGEKNGCTTSSSRITMLYFKNRISWQEGLSKMAKKAGKFLHFFFSFFLSNSLSV